ncbi:MAG TPA: nucleotide exchange factor GrpE, partial [Candidatus Polarisedimenticolia bacterium]|nr:nucleotide exchange factor GrpE [Candidatus Polarisedimenticolia bacterium]
MSARPSGKSKERPSPGPSKDEEAASCALPEDGDIEILEVTGVNETEPLIGGEQAAIAHLEHVPQEAEGAHDPHAAPHHAGGGDHDLRRRLDTAERDLNEAEKEKERLHDLWLRAQADAENARKRLDREAAERRVNETAERIRRLLPILDSLERAIASAGWGDDGLRQGVALTLQQMLEILARDGLKPVESKGVRFDPHFHEAVEMLPGSG